ncbi:HAD family hydrolase [Endozoicomonas arenosclerae]|uniref:HAD family hydrolase n=1 Tax=Endozoicomonas arenosclerae TaxID=1633495 RepID=UPI0007802117|nr:HAD family hydrolase [Endozoicomonas arenosclerae]
MKWLGTKCIGRFVLSTLFFLFGCNSVQAAPLPPLSTWNDGANKQAIIEYVKEVVSRLPVSQRVVVFDVDGTLIVEKPQPMAMFMGVDHLCEKKKLHPETFTGQVYEQACLRNFTWLDTHLNAVQLTAFLNETADSTRRYGVNYLNKPANPVYQAPLRSLFYLPMADLIEYLLENQFMVYLVSGSDETFVRALVNSAEFDDLDQDKLNIPDSHVLSQTVLLHLNEKDGTFVRTYQFRPPNN